MPTSGMLANAADLGPAVLKPFSCAVSFTLCAELPPLVPLPARRRSYSINNFKSFVGFYVAGDTACDNSESNLTHQDRLLPIANDALPWQHWSDD